MNSLRLTGSTQVERDVPDLDSDTEVYDGNWITALDAVDMRDGRPNLSDKLRIFFEQRFRMGSDYATAPEGRNRMRSDHILASEGRSGLGSNHLIASERRSGLGSDHLILSEGRSRLKSDHVRYTSTLKGAGTSWLI